METGTGKTYCYIKTMFEMHKRFGWSKFIIIVPSIAIREGIYKSFQITAEHFAEAYGKKARFFIYNSKRLHEKTKGYEYYGEMAKMRNALPAATAPADIYLSDHLWGSPATCLEKLRSVNDQMGTNDFIAVFSYGSMPVEKAEKSMRLFAEHVLTTAQDFTPGELPTIA